ncbi:DUF5686 and carboxypeptidase regulatory-like domain-containing protein [Aquirufa sp. A-Brett2-15D]
MKIFFLFLCCSMGLHAQTLSGIVRSNKGELMPFATIWVNDLNRGTLANEDGKYALTLPKGEHEVVFRFLGHTPKLHRLIISGDVSLDVVLSEEAITLQDVNVGGLKEDPAIGMMRRMISMAPFHLKEIDRYSAKGYVKGAGKITSISKVMNALVGKKMEKEAGIKVGSTYVLEGINQITYTKPNKIEEKVLSNRNNLPSVIKNSGAPNLRITQTNFYQPKVWFSLISPISPSAFSFYTFAYLGSFQLNGQTVSKIQVRPKSASSDLFEGTLSIVEDTWSIYSFSLAFRNSQGYYTFQQQNALFQGVWMPINYDVNVNFEAMGFGATFRYITQVKEYSIKVNPAYVVKPTIIEERLHKDWAKEINKEKIATPKLALSSDITRKKLKKVLKELDKEEKKEVKEEFSSDYTFTVDSTASTKKEEFWASERQVPLTEAEVKGYKEADSLYVQDDKKRLKDSVNALPRFRYGDIFNARTYSYGLKGLGARLSVSGFESGYNAVDGASLGRSVDYRFTYKLADYWGTGLNIQYAFSRKAWNGSVYAERNWDENRQRIRFSGGSSVLQINNTEPISSSVNLIYALFLSQNYLKLYQKDFIQAFYSYQLNAKWNVSSTLEYRNRSSLVNHESTGFFFKERTFESNGDSFAANSQLFAAIRLRFQPLASWRRFNGARRLSNELGPTFMLNMEKAGGDYAYSRLSFQISQSISLANWGDLNYRISGAHFINKPSILLDYQHFKGNEVNVVSGQTDFLALPYYQLSNPNGYFKAILSWEPRKFILTQNALLSLYGLKEKVGYAYLQTSVSSQVINYQEISYGLTGIGKILGIVLVYPIGSVVPEKWKVLVRLPF